MYTPQEEDLADIVVAARSGDREAWSDLAEILAPYAGKLANRICRTIGGDPDDLFQAAQLGLHAAIDTWRPSRGPFRAWAWTKMRSTVLDEALRQAGNRVPELLLDEEIEIDGEPAGATLGDLLEDSGTSAPDEICINGQCAADVRIAVAEAAGELRLPGVHGEREAAAYTAIAGGRLLAEDPMGLTELAGLLGLTPQRVGQMEEELLERVGERLEPEEES